MLLFSSRTPASIFLKQIFQNFYLKDNDILSKSFVKRNQYNAVEIVYNKEKYVHNFIGLNGRLQTILLHRTVDFS